MRRRFPFSVLLAAAVLTVSAVPSLSQQDTLLGGGRAPASSDRAVRPALPVDPAVQLDADFAALAAAATPREAHGPERRILAAFGRSGSDTVDLLMTWSSEALAAKNYAEALDLLDQALVLDPDYAEIYNRRATVYYALDDYTRSMQDIRVTLALEPRHFGALSGLAAILRELGDDERAADVYRRILAIHPTLEAAKTELEKLDQTLKGDPT